MSAREEAIEIFRRWSDGIRFCTHEQNKDHSCVHENSGHFHCVKSSNGFYADEYIKAVAAALEQRDREVERLNEDRLNFLKIQKFDQDNYRTVVSELATLRKRAEELEDCRNVFAKDYADLQLKYDELDRAIRVRVVENEMAFEEIAALRERAEKMVGIIKMALDELGIPQPEYPAPITNAVNLLKDALAVYRGGEGEKNGV